MRAYLLMTILSAATLASAYGASWSGSRKDYQGTFHQGDVGDLYIIQAHNDGGFGTDGTLITVKDTLPTGLKNPRWTGVPAGWTCTTTATTATCTTTVNGAIPAGGTVDLFLLVDVSSTAPSSVTNDVSFDGGGATNGFTFHDPTPITGVPSLTITKTQQSPSYNGLALPITSGQSVTYRIDVDNQGGAPTTGTITVVDTFASDMVVTNAYGAGWFCHVNNVVTPPTLTKPEVITPVVTCTTNNVIPAATSATHLGEIPDIFITASLVGNTASDSATVSGGGSSSASTGTVSTGTDAFSSVKISSNTGYVYTDGAIYPSPVTMQWDGTLTHTIYGYPNCKITAISGFSISESEPAVAPYTEVTGKATSSNVAVTCQ